MAARILPASMARNAESGVGPISGATNNAGLGERLSIAGDGVSKRAWPGISLNGQAPAFLLTSGRLLGAVK